ncbi:hypothetical protein [Catenuloplanes atrovinosus]|uniref:Uncharacterized protein n=1 Tax=Catenuloplanes atrovinosus TaxID=137266 RepID=A0AAE4CCV7_9ACTN|nr:hypothetical protein [Catenuloplanes atrovinosus]MDR7279657.1 hypothetical protein [Catenuloplanes atrovinosus]
MDQDPEEGRPSADSGEGGRGGGRGDQPTLFGVEAHDPGVADLAGLLAGPGEIVRMGGTARVSVTVAEPWRVHVLVPEITRRGLQATWSRTEDERLEVRTAYATTLMPLGRAWLREPGDPKRPPRAFFLNGFRLRLWVAAAGAPDASGYVLRLGRDDEPVWEIVRAALHAAGLPSRLTTPPDGEPGLRISGRRRIARLADLVGERPDAAPESAWPS